MCRSIGFLTQPSFQANCIFGWANFNLGMTLLGYNSLALLKENDIIKGVVVVGNGLNEVFIDIYAPDFQFTREILQQFFDFCFNQAVRVSARIAESNHKSQDFVERLGFTKEGIARLGFAGKENAIIYGLTKEDWYNGKFINTKI